MESLTMERRVHTISLSGCSSREATAPVRATTVFTGDIRTDDNRTNGGAMPPGYEGRDNRYSDVRVAA
jgi:hypothetical protein